MNYFELNPEASGTFGESVEFDGSRQDRPPRVTKMAFDFEQWPEDCIIETICNFIITEPLKQALEQVSPPLTGCSFGHVEITTEEQQFDELYGDRELPNFVWLKIEGTACKDDFGYSQENSLVVSERVLEVIKLFPHKYLDMKEYKS